MGASVAREAFLCANTSRVASELAAHRSGLRDGHLPGPPPLLALVQRATSMFDAFYEREAAAIRQQVASLEGQLYHEAPVSAQLDASRRSRTSARSRAVYAQTEFAPDMAEWHSTPHLQPSLRVRGKAIDLTRARVSEVCEWVGR